MSLHSGLKDKLAQMTKRELEIELLFCRAELDRAKAEIQPWRQMARQLEGLVEIGWRVRVDNHDIGWTCLAEQAVGRVVWDRAVCYGTTLPAAVDAAYRQVKGGSDE